MKKYTVLFSLIAMFSCKAQAVVSETIASQILNPETIIENNLNNKIDFATLVIKANVKYKDDKTNQNVSAEIKIQKNEKISVIVRFLGFTMAKALITPTTVLYYEKLGGKYFEGDYTTLSRWLGTDLDFEKLQNLFLGKPLNDLTKDTFLVSILDNFHKLQSVKDSTYTKNYFFESEKFLIKKQEFNQVNLNRALQISYPSFQQINDIILPLSLIIDANVDNSTNNITIDYKSVLINEEITFTYSVPEGYERIFIK